MDSINNFDQRRFRYWCVHCNAELGETPRIERGDLERIEAHLRAEHRDVPIDDPLSISVAMRHILVRMISGRLTL